MDPHPQPPPLRPLQVDQGATRERERGARPGQDEGRMHPLLQGPPGGAADGKDKGAAGSTWHIEPVQGAAKQAAGASLVVGGACSIGWPGGTREGQPHQATQALLGGAASPGQHCASPGHPKSRTARSGSREQGRTGWQ